MVRIDYMIPKLDSTLFDWRRWRAGDVHDLDIQATRYALLTSIDGKRKLKEYAIGWCLGENLRCRPKLEIAVMFEKNDVQFWFHMRMQEFEEVFRLKAVF
jgi:hypothetical protein